MTRKLTVFIMGLIFVLFVAALMVHRNHPERPWLQSWQSAEDACDNMCNSYAQDYSQILQYSMGTCICDNKEGRKVADGYHMYLNGQCK